jgi:hypothetical protein
VLKQSVPSPTGVLGHSLSIELPTQDASRSPPSELAAPSAAERRIGQVRKATTLIAHYVLRSALGCRETSQGNYCYGVWRLGVAGWGNVCRVATEPPRKRHSF